MFVWVRTFGQFLAGTSFALEGGWITAAGSSKTTDLFAYPFWIFLATLLLGLILFLAVEVWKPEDALELFYAEGLASGCLFAPFVIAACLFALGFAAFLVFRALLS